MLHVVEILSDMQVHLSKIRFFACPDHISKENDIICHSNKSDSNLNGASAVFATN